LRILFRSFSDDINSKTGAKLPNGQKRGNPDWIEFQNLFIEILKDLGHQLLIQKENPLLPDDVSPIGVDRKIYVHKTKKDKPEGDLFWMNMHLRELYTVDTTGWGEDHSGIKDCIQFFPHEDEVDSIQFCEEMSDKLHASGLSKCVQDEITDKTPDNFILVPVQIPRDYTIKWHSPVTVRYFIDSIQAWAVENKYHVCFKMHPHNTGDIDLHQSIDDAIAGSRYVHKVKGNIHELIKRSSGLFVINSGTGFEALIHGKPVATFGACDYSRATFNADIRRLDEARTALYSYKEEFRRIAYKFVFWYYHRHAYWLRDPRMKDRLTAYIKGVLI
jgi:hypothetical protein